MSKELKVIWQHGRIYGLGRVLDRLSALLLIPVLVHVLEPAQWGVYVLVLVMMEVLAVAPGALLSAMIRLYFDETPEDAASGQDSGARRVRHRSEVVGTTLALLGGIGLIMAPLAWPIGQLSAGLFGLDDVYVDAFALGVVAICFNLLFEVGLNVYRVEKLSTVFMLASLVRTVLQFSLSIYFVVAWDLGVLGVVLGYLVSVGIISLAIVSDILRRGSIAFSPEVARETLRVGLPLAPAGLAHAALELIERSLVNSLAGTAALGIYGLGARLAQQLRVLMAGPFGDIWQIRLMELSEQPKSKAELHRVQVYFLALLATTALGLSLLSVEVVMVIADQSFWQAATIVPLLAFAQLVRPVNYFFQSALLERKKTVYVPIVNWGTVAVGAGALYLLIPSHGIQGAAVAMIIAYSCRLGGLVYFASRSTDYAKLFPWGSYAGILVLAVLSYVIAMATIGPGIGLFQLLLKGVILLGFVVALYFGPVFTDSERALMRRQVGRLARRLADAVPGR